VWEALEKLEDDGGFASRVNVDIQKSAAVAGARFVSA
jgi:hypothetical protein